MKEIEFWSSVELATFQKGLVRALEDSGWKASHRFEVSQSGYWRARSRLERLGLRIRTYLLYPLRVAAHYLGPDRGRIGVICTNTFFAPWVASMAVGRRRRPVIHWVLDLYPDVLVAAGAMRPESSFGRLVRRLVRSTFDRASANVFLGSQLREYAERQYGPIPRAFVIPVGCDAGPFRELKPAARPLGAPIRILYSGNLGRMHDTETFLTALGYGLPRSVSIEFLGNGPAFRHLESQVRALALGESIRFGENLPEAEWVRAMCAADVGLVMMRPGAEGIVMPSKTYSCLAAGQAVLAICPENSDLAQTVRAHGCGWVLNPGDASGLSALWKEMAAHPSEVLHKRQRAWQAGQNAFDQRKLVASWISVLDSVRQQDD
jgi:glycosyltransferase involved in cell wall biosynthesis